jgi:ArsR family transcriptional regulator
VFKAFCDETRLLVLSLLQSGEKCACDLLEQVSVGQSTLSHHMKILVESGVVASRKEGKWMYYSISEAGSEKAILLLKRLTEVAVNQTETRKACCAWIKDVVPKVAAVVQKA